MQPHQYTLFLDQCDTALSLSLETLRGVQFTQLSQWSNHKTVNGLFHPTWPFYTSCDHFSLFHNPVQYGVPLLLDTNDQFFDNSCDQLFLLNEDNDGEWFPETPTTTDQKEEVLGATETSKGEGMAIFSNLTVPPILPPVYDNTTSTMNKETSSLSSEPSLCISPTQFFIQEPQDQIISDGDKCVTEEEVKDTSTGTSPSPITHFRLRVHPSEPMTLVSSHINNQETPVIYPWMLNNKYPASSSPSSIKHRSETNKSSSHRYKNFVPSHRQKQSSTVTIPKASSGVKKSTTGRKRGPKAQRTKLWTSKNKSTGKMMHLFEYNYVPETHK